MKTENGTRICRNCLHFHQRLRGQADAGTLIAMEAGLCCAHAPTAGFIRGFRDGMEIQPWAQFPLVDEEMTCGEFCIRADGRTRGTRTDAAGRVEGFRPCAATRCAESRGRTRGTP